MSVNVRVEARPTYGSSRGGPGDGRVLALIRQFKRAVNEAGVLHTLKAKAFYEKPGEKRRRRRRQFDLQKKYAAFHEGDPRRIREQRGYGD